MIVKERIFIKAPERPEIHGRPIDGAEAAATGGLVSLAEYRPPVDAELMVPGEVVAELKRALAQG